MTDQYFDRLLQILQNERAEDLRMYQQTMLQTPLHERRSKGHSWYPIQITTEEIGAGGHICLHVERTKNKGESHAFQPGDAVSLFRNHDKEPARMSGVISWVWRDNMKIVFAEDELPDWLYDGQLGLDLLFDDLTYKEMENALLAVKKAKDGRLKALVEILTGQQPATFLPHAEATAAHNSPHFARLNASQQEAVRHIVAANDVAIVHGPPGTGKTTTLVQAITVLSQQHKQILVTAPSNTAVDLLTEKLATQGLKVLRIGNPARVSEDLMQYSLEAQITEHPEARRLKQVRKQADEFRKMAFKYKRSFGPQEREQRKLLMAESKKLMAEAADIEKYLTQHLLDSAQIITATLVGSVHKYIRNRQFALTFIDEAGQALEPACWIPIAKSQKIVLAGDPFQLPPTVKSAEAQKQGLAETLLEKLMKNGLPSAMLRTQYRMNEQIMQFSNEQFYRQNLEAADSVRHHVVLPADELWGNPVEFVDTAGCGFEEKTHEQTTSKQNPEEADLLCKHLVSRIEYLRMLQGTFPANLSIGVVSPYSAQVDALRDKIRRHPDLQDLQSQITVQTIDGFQGQERDIMYISLVRSNEQQTIGFLSDTRRMNVALTRARKKLVVIGDSATLSGHKFYADFLQYIDRINAYKSAWEFISLDN